MKYTMFCRGINWVFSKSQKNIMKYKLYRQPTRCNNNGILIIPLSSTCFGQLFYPSSGAQSSAPEDGKNNCPKHVELTGIINMPLLLHLIGCLCYLYQWCTVKQISDNEIYMLIKYIKSVLWRVAKRLSYIEDDRCRKVTLRHRGRKTNLQYCAVLLAFKYRFNIMRAVIRIWIYKSVLDYVILMLTPRSSEWCPTFRFSD